MSEKKIPAKLKYPGRLHVRILSNPIKAEDLVQYIKDAQCGYNSSNLTIEAVQSGGESQLILHSGFIPPAGHADLVGHPTHKDCKIEVISEDGDTILVERVWTHRPRHVRDIFWVSSKYVQRL